MKSMIGIEAEDLPKVAGADRHTIENWYFPVMAYNGIKPANSPILPGERAATIKTLIKKKSLLRLKMIVS